MLNKEINIPNLKISHLLIILSVLILLFLNAAQWYLNKDNHIERKEFKEKDKRISFKLDSITKKNTLLINDLKTKDTLILHYKNEALEQTKLRKVYKNESLKRKNDYNSLNNNERYNTAKNILSKRLHK